MEQVNEPMLKQLKENFRKIVVPKRTINLLSVLKNLIIKDNKEFNGEIELDEIIKEVFSAEINENESTSQQFSIVSQFRSDDMMDIENEFHNNEDGEGEINLNPEKNSDYEDLLDDILNLLKKFDNKETKKKLLNEVKKYLEPELTELSEMNQN
jgi:hypothetical protein